MAIRKALTPNSNVGFKFGTQAAADKIIADGVGAVEGSFYLTDAHRLYIGAANDAANGYTLYSVNEGVISVDSISNLTAYTPGTPDAIANTGRFFYIKDVNILAVFSGSEYVQINKYSDNSIDKVEITGSAAQNVAEITTKVTDNNKNAKQDYFKIEAAGGLTLTWDAIEKKLTIDDDTLTLHSGATDILNENAVLLKLNAANDSTKDSSIKISGSGATTITQANDVITIDSSDTLVKELKIENDPNTGFKVTVVDTKENKKYATMDPIIAYGNGSEENNTLTKVKFINGQAKLDVYSKDEVRDLMKALNAMTYKGTMGIAGSGSYSGGIRIDPSTNSKFVRNVTNTADIKSKIGDTIIAATDMTIGDNTYAKGSMFICRSTDGTEDSDGYILPSKLEFDIIASTVDTDTTYKFSRLKDTTKHGFNLLNKHNTDVGRLILEQATLDRIKYLDADGQEKERDAHGANIIISSSYGQTTQNGEVEATIKFGHEIVLRHDTTGAEIIQGDTTNETFTIVSGVTTDDTGHITGVQTTQVTVKDTVAHVSAYTIATSKYAHDGSDIGVVKHSVTTEDVAHNKVTKDDYFILASKSLQISNDDTHGVDSANATSGLKQGLSIDMVWGTFGTE